jgi:hypothetical protein
MREAPELSGVFSRKLRRKPFEAEPFHLPGDVDRENPAVKERDRADA